MNKYSQCIWYVCLIIGFFLLATENSFSQATQSENKVEVKDNTTTTLNKDTGYVKGITIARAISLVEGLLGLMSIVIGWRAKARLAKNGARTALVLGLLAAILSIVHLATTAGAVFGSGSGKAGSILALLLGLVGIILGGLTLRSRNTNL